MLRAFTLVATIGAAVLAACTNTAAVTPSATVTFVFDAPLCSTIVPVQFSIDSLLVGADTFKIAVAGGPHTTSRGFATPPGQHTLSARTTAGYIWPTTRVTLVAGQTFVDSLPFYCS